MADTVRRVVDDNELPPRAVRALQSLADDLPDERIRPLRGEAPDADAWASWTAPYVGVGWLDVPWFFAETYLFRRILEAVSFFEGGPDPFARQKALALAAVQADLPAVAASATAGAEWTADGGERLLRAALWGNQADLNLWPADGDGPPQHADAAAADAHLLADDGAAVARYLDARGAGLRVDLVTDNAGAEFVADLALVDALLESGRARRVHLHVKAHPTFVSDVTMDDVALTFAAFETADAAGVRDFGTRLVRARDGGRLSVETAPYWTSPLPGWAMPARLRAVLGRSDLIVVKGDANYRRLLGDRHWPFSTPFERVTAYAPAPLAALRTLKSEVAVGIAPARSRADAAADPEWLVGGRWGVVQFAGRGENR